MAWFSGGVKHVYLNFLIFEQNDLSNEPWYNTVINMMDSANLVLLYSNCNMH